jgi:hypothetical protein
MDTATTQEIPMRSTNFKGHQKKGMNSVRGRRFKKQGGQTGGSGYNERVDGAEHDRDDNR